MKAKLNRLALLAQRTQARQKAAIGAVGAAVLMASSVAHAELPAPAQAALDGVLAGFTDLETAAWPIMGGIVSGLILMKLFKKVVNKAT